MRVVTGALVFVSLWVLFPPSAVAQSTSGQGNGDGFDGGSVDAGAEGGSAPEFVVSVLGGEDAPWTAVSEDACRYDVLEYGDAFTALAEYLGLTSEWITTATPAELPEAWAHPWLVTYCPFSFGGLALTSVVQIGVEPPDAATMQWLVRGPMQLSLPEPMFSPDAGAFQVTGIETWVWVPVTIAAPITVSRCTGPNDYACASMTAAFSHLEIDMGDGSPPMACTGVVAYDTTLEYEQQVERPHCGHVYTVAPEAGAYPVTVAAAWSLIWSCWWDQNLDGVRESTCGGGPLLPAGRTAPTVQLEVREIQARATR